MLNLLQDAFSNNTLDMFTGGFVSVYAGAQTNRAMEQVKALAHRSEKEFKAAVNLCPEIPNEYLANIRSSDFLAFANIFLDSFAMDYIVRQNIRKNIVATGNTLKTVEKSLQWMRNHYFESALEQERVRLVYTH